MGFRVGFGLTGEDSWCLRGCGHLLGHLRDLGLKHFSVCGDRIYLGIELGERIIQKSGLGFELLELFRLIYDIVFHLQTGFLNDSLSNIFTIGGTGRAMSLTLGVTYFCPIFRIFIPNQLLILFLLL